jgi:hypothetical protein
MRLLAVAVLAAVLVPAAGAQTRVTVDRTNVSTALGHTFSFSTTITGDGSSEPLVAHLNILSVRPGVYVDPEDWSSNRTRYLGVVPAGKSVATRWNLKAVNGGEFAAYVSVLPERAGGRVPANSAAVQVAVAKRQTLNSGGIVPLAAGIPALLAFLALAVRWQRRRR